MSKLTELTELAERLLQIDGQREADDIALNEVEAELRAIAAPGEGAAKLAHFTIEHGPFGSRTRLLLDGWQVPGLLGCQERSQVGGPLVFELTIQVEAFTVEPLPPPPEARP